MTNENGIPWETIDFLTRGDAPMTKIPEEFMDEVDYIYKLIYDEEKYFKTEVMPKTKKLVRELEEEYVDTAWAKSRREEYLIEELKETDRHIDFAYERYRAMMKRGLEQWVCELWRKHWNKLDEYKKKRKKLKWELNIIQGKYKDGSIGYADIKFAETKDISDFIELNRGGFACCPFHTEKTGSFKVYAEGSRAKCFGCGWSGNVIKFIMEFKKMTFPETVKFLSRGSK